MLGGNDFHNLVGGDRLARGHKPPQGSVDKIKPFVLGGVQQLEILLDRGSFRCVLEQLVVGHAESRRGVHVVHVLVIDERTRLANQRVDHMAKVDRFLAKPELSRHPLDAFVAIPQFQMILVNAYFESQTDILAADRVRVALHADDAVGLDRHQDRCAGTATLWRQRAERGDFFAKPFVSRDVAPLDERTDEPQIVLGADKIAASAQPQRLVQGILEVTVRRLHVSIFVRLADVDAMAIRAIVCE